MPLQPSDVSDTFSDTTDLTKATGHAPKTSVEDGVARHVELYLDQYGARP